MAVRLPEEAKRAAKMATRLAKVNLSDLVRMGLEIGLARVSSQLVELAKDPDANPRKRLAAVKALHEFKRAQVSLHEPLPTVRVLRRAEREARRISRRAARKLRREDRLQPEGTAGDQGDEHRQDQAMFGTAVDPLKTPWTAPPAYHEPDNGNEGTNRTR